MQINIHLNFNGRCQEAFEFYEKAFGGKIVYMMTYGDSPMASQFSPDWHRKIMHASFECPGGSFMGADSPVDRFQQPQGFAVTLSFSDPAEADRVFQALSEKAVVTMPISETFWAQRFGMLTDQFGTPWMINCSKPQF